MHWKLLAFSGIAAALALPSVAGADVIDDISVVGGGGYTITFSVPATGITPDHPHGVYLGDSTVMTINGFSGAGSVDFLAHFTGLGLPAVILYLPVFSQLPSAPSILLLNGPAVDTSLVVPTSNPEPIIHPDDLQLTLVPGVYSFLNEDATIGSDPSFTLTITQETTPTGATPEPGTFPLLSTGLVGGWSMLRRRRVR